MPVSRIWTGLGVVYIRETTQNVEKHQGVNDGEIKSLEGYFDNLAAAAVNETLVLEQLVVNNTKLAATNENLVAIVQKLTNDIKYLESETSHLKKGGKSSGIPPCATIARKKGIMRLRHATSW